jgi:hypothetical protein
VCHPFDGVAESARHNPAQVMKSRAPAPRSAINANNVTAAVPPPRQTGGVCRGHCHMRKAKPKTTPASGAGVSIETFKQLKREQMENVKVLLKAVPKMLAARAQEMSAGERRELDQKIQYCKDRIRFCYFLYTDAVSLLGPKPKWLTVQ